MKALLKVAGGPDSPLLEDIPEPAQQPREVVVAIKGCGVNYPNIPVFDDRYQAKPERPFSFRLEVAGVVTALGEGVCEPPLAR